MKLTHNKVAFLAILFMLISLSFNIIIYQKASIQITGKATAQGYVIICLNRPPILNEFPTNLTAEEGETFFYDVNATDANNATQNLTFYDNASLFDIEQGTGIINFTAPGSSNGIYHILITVQDNSTCANRNNTQTLILNISSANVAPSITSYYPLENPTINETWEQLFNISYEDGDNDTLTIYWYLNNSLVSSFNDASNILKSNYTFVGNYTNAGIYIVNVIASDTLLNDSHNWTLTVTNVNRAPGFNRTINNQTWPEDSVLYGLDLDDYSYDPDIDDTLSYSVNYLTSQHSIIVDINENNVVTFSQPSNWYGSDNISFNVIDDKGASNTSNNITLTVYDVPETHVTTTITGAQGPGRTLECIEYWFCTFWSVCYPDGFMKRTCTDLTDCGTEYYKPFEMQNCTDIPSCFNRVKDGDETDIDCGGSCGPCPSCFDGIMDNDETGIDCGGSCLPCPTCFDGVMNGGEIGIDCGGACALQDCCMNGYRDAHIREIGIDCGGPCKECEIEIEKPAPKRLIWITIMGGIMLIWIAILIYLNIERIKLFSLHIMKRFGKKEIRPARRIGNVILSSVDKLEKKIESKSTEKALNEFLITLRNILAMIFRIKYEFTYEDIISIIEESKLKTTIKSILTGYIRRMINITYSGYSINKEELILLTKELRIIVHLITRPTKEKKEKNGEYIKEKKRYETNLEKFYMTLSSSLFMLEGMKTEKAKELYLESEEIYNQLLPDEKNEADNYMQRIGEEIRLFNKREERNKKAKDISIVAITLITLLFLGNIGIFFGGDITGLHVLERENVQLLIDIRSFNIKVGGHFAYRIIGYDHKDETLSFSDNTKLFNITSDGIIDFTPTVDNVGVHHVVIIAQDSNYKPFFKDIIFNITKDGAETGVIYTEEANETSEENHTINDELNQSENANETEKEITLANKSSETEENINLTQQINETNESSNESSGIGQDLNEPKNITEQLSEDFLIKPLNIYVKESEFGDIAEVNLLVENLADREIENAYFKILTGGNNSSMLIDIQSIPLTIPGKEKTELVAQWNTENAAIRNYTGKLIIIYENKTSEEDMIIDVTTDKIQTEIIGITGMVTAPSSIVEIQSYINIPPILIWIIFIILLMDAAWFLIYSKKKKE